MAELEFEPRQSGSSTQALNHYPASVWVWQRKGRSTLQNRGKDVKHIWKKACGRNVSDSGQDFIDKVQVAQ